MKSCLHEEQRKSTLGLVILVKQEVVRRSFSKGRHLEQMKKKMLRVNDQQLHQSELLLLWQLGGLVVYHLEEHQAEEEEGIGFQSVITVTNEVI